MCVCNRSYPACKAHASYYIATYGLCDSTLLGAFVQPLLQWKNNIYYIFWVCVCSLIYPAYKAHASYYIATYDLSDSTLLGAFVQPFLQWKNNIYYIF